MPPPCRLAFAQLVQRPEAAIDLAQAALFIAKEEYPDLDVAVYLARLDAMGEEVQRLADGSLDPHRLIAALNEHLFRQLGFHGNPENYYDPRNSFLNEVLDRRTGIPITLSAVYLEVARRIGFPLHGVGMPGHFLVKYAGRDEEIVVDPFGGGGILSDADYQRMLDRITGRKLCFERGMLATLGTRQILARMLTNLKAIYFNNQEYAKALSIVERLVILQPQTASEIRDRGLLSCQLKRYADASADLDRYLRLVPEAEDSEV
ncbi:MAG: transglutaminase-like domain-containing protein, partial [candidate division NC10 bacterium]